MTNVGLVLSGGMAKGAFQVGALRAISEVFPPGTVNYISASSIGVLNAYSYATGHLDWAEQMWESVCADGCRRTITQMLRSSLLQNNIQMIVGDAPIEADVFYCTLLDVLKRKVVYKNLKPIPNELISQYLRASVAMPLYNRAVRIENTLYFDGAMADNIPVFPLMKHRLDYLICIYFDDVSYRFEDEYFDNKIIKITYPSQTVLSQSLFFRKEGIKKMIDDGYIRTNRILRHVISDSWENVSGIYQRIESAESEKEKTIRVTGDVLVTNLNRIANKIAARKIEL
jgi:predicted acylesterase/phospholipase RssA